MKLTAYDLGHKSPADFVPPKATRPAPVVRYTAAPHVTEDERAYRQRIAVAALEKARGNKSDLGRHCNRAGDTIRKYVGGQCLVPDEVVERMHAFLGNPEAKVRVLTADEKGDRLRHIVVGCIDDLRMSRAETARYLTQRGDDVSERWVRTQYDKAMRLRGGK